MSHRIRITVKRQAEIDIDKLVLAILRALEEHGRGASTKALRESDTEPRDAGAAA
jgi:hypothetical protein